MLDDPASGLSGAIVIHSSRLGPAAGGCRLWHYSGRPAALADAMRLAEGMAYKNAVAGLPLGGGKAVLQMPARLDDRAKLFRAFGKAVEALGGRYVTAEDVGTSVDDMEEVGAVTGHVAGRARRPGRPGGDPSPWTARGVFVAMQVAAERRLGRPLADCTVAVQGLGHVGAALAALLHRAGARLIVADPRPGIAAGVACRTGAEIMSKDAIVDAAADVFAPCALGGVLDEGSIARLRATLVCGAANNQLATPDDGARLARRGILYAPDYVVNAGGIINVAAEYLGWNEGEVARRVDATGTRLATVLDLAERDETPPDQAADQLAAELMAAGAPAAVRAVA